MQDCWVVVGASSSVARAFALEAARSGASVVLAGRDVEDLETSAEDLRIRTGQSVSRLDFDAANFESHDGFVRASWEAASGRSLSLFFAAGTMPDQDAALKDFRIAKSVVDVNYLAVVSLLTRLEPGLRAQKGGAVVVLGSVAGDRGRRKNFLYGSAKAGVHAFLQGMRGHLLADGVKVITVKPGFLDTAMTWGLPGLFLVASPEAAAKACLRAVRKGKDELYFPGFWRLIMTVIKAIPETVFKRLSI